MRGPEGFKTTSTYNPLQAELFLLINMISDLWDGAWSMAFCLIHVVCQMYYAGKIPEIFNSTRNKTHTLQYFCRQHCRRNIWIGSSDKNCQYLSVQSILLKILRRQCCLHFWQKIMKEGCSTPLFWTGCLFAIFYSNSKPLKLFCKKSSRNAAGRVIFWR